LIRRQFWHFLRKLDCLIRFPNCSVKKSSSCYLDNIIISVKEGKAAQNYYIRYRKEKIGLFYKE